MLRSLEDPPLFSSHQNSRLYHHVLEEEHQSPREEEYSANKNKEPNFEDREDQVEEEEKIQMVIDFGNNNSQSLIVGPRDDPLTLSKKFCFKNNIDPHVIPTLASNISSLQATSFKSSFKLQKNPCMERNNTVGKQNFNSSNYGNLSRSRSQQKNNANSRISYSRTKTNQSFLNESHTVHRKNNYSVFQRLYQDSRKKQTARTSSKVDNSRLTVGSLNPNKPQNQSSIRNCVNIYDKNTRLKEESQIHNQHLRQEKQKKEVKQCSFQPKINPISNIIASKLKQMDQSSILDRSYNDKSITKIKQYILEKQQQEMKECTFKPKIISKLPNSSQLQSNLRIYQKQTKIIEEEKFIPQINKISKIIIKKGFYERLEEDKQKRVQKRKSMQKLSRENRDRRPSTGRAPANRNLNSKTIGQYLFEQTKKSRALSTKQPPKVHTDPRSSYIHSQSKSLAVQYIFDLLDCDQDGLISSKKINISMLPQQILKLLAPLLAEMEEVEVELNLQQFSTAFQRLFKTFSIDQKNIILKSYKNQQANSRSSERPSFNPSLNQCSLRIARQLCGDSGDIYENSINRLKQRESKLNRMRAQKLLDQYSECTFHPRVHHY